MRYTIFLIALVLLMPMACSRSSERGSQGALPGEAYLSFTGDGAWCWFSDPRAIYYEGDFSRTYAGWVDSTGNIVVGSYDHENGWIQTQVLHEKLERDDHDNPSFLMGAHDRLLVFYSKHGTGNHPILMKRASKKEDITSWDPPQALRLNDTVTYAGFSNTYTYTNIIRLTDEGDKLYLFWRGSDFKPNFSTSSDEGLSWEPGKILVLPERIYRDRRPYMKVASNGKDVIHFAFTDGHPNAEPENSIYYMKYRAGKLYKANGDTIKNWAAAPVDPKEADVVYDARASKEKAWIWDIAEDRNGSPVVVYTSFPTDTTHVYHYSIFEAGRWNTSRLVDAGSWFPHTRDGMREREPNYSGGIVLDHSDPSQVYLSREINGVFEIEHWSTKDGGRTWSAREITRDSKYDNVRPFVIRHHGDDSVKVLWMNIQKYAHYTDYRGEIKISIPDRREIYRK